jgi:hypothetical protein
MEMDVRVITLGMILLAMSTQPTRAQVLDRPSSTEPRAWISGALGLFDLGTVDDGVTATSWRFANAAQFRASIEYSLGRGNSIGVLAAYARVPLRYAPFAGAAEDAMSTVSALALTFHGGGGVGLHQVIEASVGALRYSDFVSEEDGQALAPPGTDLDVTFMIGGGFGYSIGTRTQIVLVQDFGIALHQRTDLPNDASTSTYYRTTRLGLRHGVGTATRR